MYTNTVFLSKYFLIKSYKICAKFLLIKMKFVQYLTNCNLIRLSKIYDNYFQIKETEWNRSERKGLLLYDRDQKSFLPVSSYSTNLSIFNISSYID